MTGLSAFEPAFVNMAVAVVAAVAALFLDFLQTRSSQSRTHCLQWSSPVVLEAVMVNVVEVEVEVVGRFLTSSCHP